MIFTFVGALNIWFAFDESSYASALVAVVCLWIGLNTLLGELKRSGQAAGGRRQGEFSSRFGGPPHHGAAAQVQGLLGVVLVLRDLAEHHTRRNYDQHDF